MLLWHLLSPLHFWVLIRPTQLWQLWQQGQLRPCAFRQSLLACDSLGILFEAEVCVEVMEVLWATCPWRSWKHLVTNSVEATERAHFRLRFDQIWLKLQQTRTHTHTYTHTETKCTATASAGRSIEWGKTGKSTWKCWLQWEFNFNASINNLIQLISKCLWDVEQQELLQQQQLSQQQQLLQTRVQNFNWKSNKK